MDALIQNLLTAIRKLRVQITAPLSLITATRMGKIDTINSKTDVATSTRADGAVWTPELAASLVSVARIKSIQSYRVYTSADTSTAGYAAGYREVALSTAVSPSKCVVILDSHSGGNFYLNSSYFRFYHPAGASETLVKYQFVVQIVEFE